MKVSVEHYLLVANRAAGLDFTDYLHTFDPLFSVLYFNQISYCILSPDAPPPLINQPHTHTPTLTHTDTNTLPSALWLRLTSPDSLHMWLRVDKITLKNCQQVLGSWFVS